MNKQQLIKALGSIEKREKGILDVQVKDSLEKLRQVEFASTSAKLQMIESIQRNTAQALKVINNLKRGDPGRQKPMLETYIQRLTK